MVFSVAEGDDLAVEACRVVRQAWCSPWATAYPPKFHWESPNHAVEDAP